jgi:hypothetical protein
MSGVPDGVFGTSIALVEGDFTLVNGDLAPVSGTQNLGQALQIIVGTPFGSDQVNVTYGLNVAAIFTVAASVSSIKDVIRLNLVNSLSSDNRIREVDAILFDDEPGFAALAPEFGNGDPAATARRSRLWHAVIALTTVAGNQQQVLVSGASP